MHLDEISYEKANGVAEVTLDRPDRLNPISARDGGTRDQILWALGDAEADEAIGCVLIRGAGRAFSAGGDLAGNAPRETPFEHNQFLERVERFHDRIRGATLPVVAAVHGYCLGTAMQLVAACDFVVAADTARLGFPEGRMGLAGVSPLVTTVGRQWAKFLITTGELIDADQARNIGLVLSVEPAEELLGRARDCASGSPGFRAKPSYSTSERSMQSPMRRGMRPHGSSASPTRRSLWLTALAQLLQMVGASRTFARPRESRASREHKRPSTPQDGCDD